MSLPPTLKTPIPPLPFPASYPNPTETLAHPAPHSLPNPLHPPGPSVPQTQPHSPLPNQVAGHPSLLSDASGSLVIKPALPREIAFYQLVSGSSRASASGIRGEGPPGARGGSVVGVGRLKGWIPGFLGTLRLEGRVGAGGGLEEMGEGEGEESVVLENLAHDYTRPSILDVKLGTVLSSPDATPEKRSRMEKQARESTSWGTGLRLTGCQTWHAPSNSYILTPKSFGKTIPASALSQGMRRFFPLPTDSIDTLSSAIPLSASAPPSTARNSDSTPQSYPLQSLTPPPPVPLHPVAAAIPSGTYTDHAIPPQLMLRVLDILDEELGRLIDVLQTMEVRFIGSSVLVVYEGDESRLSEAVERYDLNRKATEEAEKLVISSTAQTKRTAGRDDTGPVGHEDEDEDEEYDDDIDEDFFDEDEEESSTSSDDDSTDGARADARKARRCPPLTLRMIDFAHTRLAEGEGPDVGVLKGLGTLRGLVRGRKEEVGRVQRG